MVLREGKGDGVWWTKSSEEGPDIARKLILQAATGPFEGWRLDFADEKVKIGESVAHRLILTEKPQNIKRFGIGEMDK